ncbi:MAG: oligopeptide transporter, OPT family [Deltaproteobacteria bacterium]|nr:oligopeptide transporter, OPT family [Deltaproteobacteria bacterium]
MSDPFKPYVPDEKIIPELTWAPVVVGCLLGIVFGASSLYLALKVGMTVSASIPVAVLSITLFRLFTKTFGMRSATILENNITQTTGSAGESIAFGVAVTMPALLILGYDMELGRIMVAAVLGGLLGILMMIPLRYALVVKTHGQLKFPEGTACAKVLIAGEEGGTTAKAVFFGLFVGFFYKFLNVGLKLWYDVPEKIITWYKGSSIAAEVSPELLGVGYIIGPRVAAITCAGGILSSWVLGPAIVLFGEGLTTPLFPATKLISQMSVHEVWRNYVLYIGAGAVAAGGLFSLLQSLPTIIHSARAGLSGVAKAGLGKGTRRTERDISMKVVLGGSLLLVILIWLYPPLKMNFIGALLIVVLGFLFVTVSSRITGEIGSSSNPVSGMTVATLLATSLIFLGLGWIGPEYRVAALCVAAVACVAISNGGTTAQDLKAGFLVGATPKAQQIAILCGALTSAIVIGFTLEVLNTASTVYSKKAIPGEVHVPSVENLTKMEKVGGPESATDTNLYHVLQLPETPKEGPLSKLLPGKYLVDNSGKVQYLVDPGINGILKTRDDGSSVQKYEAPKARLMSLIIDGILAQKLPWGLVLLGVAIAIVCEMCAVSALPFAVGVYLPLSTTMPLLIGGMIRLYVDKARARKNKREEETDSSPGVLFSSGLIAGGAITGIALAILSIKEGWISSIDLSGLMPAVSTNNWTAVISFAVLGLLLAGVGRGKLNKA